MAFRIKRGPSDYLSETAFIYDIAQQHKYFDKSVYDGLSASGDQEFTKDYLLGLAGTRDKTDSDFNQTDYDYLSTPEDKANYTLYKLSGVKDAKTDAYFEQQIQAGVDRETFESLNGFQKTMNSIGGMVGNAFNEMLYGTLEGLLDAGILLVGAFGNKEWRDASREAMLKDSTGVGARREELQRYSRAYTYLDKNKVWDVANQVTTGIAQMVPMIALNYVAPGVGTGVYFASGAGNRATQILEINPDVNYAALIGYTAAGTAVEFATEKLSAKIFGGTGNFIDSQILGKATGKGLTKLGQKAAGSWVGRVGLNFLSEGLEESISEFADTVLFNAFIAQGNPELQKSFSMTDILYAGLIGGLIGGVMEGSNIATTKNLYVTKDGEFTYDKSQNGTKLSKSQTLVARDILSQTEQMLTKSAIADLKAKYPDLSIDKIKTQHKDEYNEALEIDKNINNEKLTEVLLGLNRIYEIAGDKTFKKALDLANATFEAKARLASNYYNKATGKTSTHRAIENEFKAIYGDDVSLTIHDSQSAEEHRLANNIKNQFGYDVYFGDIGTKNGKNKRFGLTISDHAIVLDSNQMGRMSEQAIIDKIVKEELVHALQFTNDIITPKTLFKLHKAMMNNGVTLESQKLNRAYSKDTALTKVTEAQAKAMAEVLLFDNLTVEKLFADNYETMSGVYKTLNAIKNGIEKLKSFRTPKGKIKYNKVLKIMQSYRKIAVEQYINADNLDKFVKDFQLTSLEAKEIKETYLQHPNVGKIKGAEHYAFAKTGALASHLKKKGVNRIDYHDKGFSDAFVELMNSPAPNDSDVENLININPLDGSTGIGNSERTNEVLDFYYKKNKHIKTIEDVNSILEKDSRGFSFLAYSIVFANNNKNKHKEGVKISYVNEEARKAAEMNKVDPKQESTGKEIRRKLIGTVKDGKPVVSKELLKKYSTQLKSIQKDIDAAVEGNRITTLLLDMDYSYSVNDSLEVAQKITSDSKTTQNIEARMVELQNKIVADPDTGKPVPYLETDDGKKEFDRLAKQLEIETNKAVKSFNEVQFSTLMSEEGEDSVIEPEDTESNPEEILIREEEGDNYNASAMRGVDRLPFAMKKFKTGIKDWAGRTGSTTQQGNELDELQQAITTIKELEKSDSQKIHISESTRKAIDELKSPQLFIDAVESALTPENAREIYKKLANNKAKIVNMYSEKNGYNVVRRVVSDYMAEHGITKRATTTKTEEQIIAEKVDSGESTTLGHALVEITGDDTYESEPSKDEEIKVLTGTVETNESNAQDVANAILKMVETSKKRLSEAQLTKATEKEYNTVSVRMVANAIFHKVTEENYTRVREIVSSNPSALSVFDEAMTMLTGANSNNRYSQEFVDKVQNLSRESITSSAQRQALQSAILKSVKPATSIVKELKEAGYAVDVTEQMLIDLDPALADKPKLIASLEQDVENLTKDLQELDENDPSEKVLMDELFDKTQALAALKSGSPADIADWLLSNLQRFKGLEISAEKTQELLEKLLEEMKKSENVDIRAKKDGELEAFPNAKKRLYKILKGMKSFRMWAMTSSPVSWLRNALGNVSMKGLDGATHVIERGISSGLTRKNKLEAGVHFETSKGSKDLQKHISETHGKYIHSLVNGETKWNSDESKKTHYRELTKQQLKDANGFKKLIPAAKLYSDYGLDSGPLGDHKFLYASVCKNMADLVSSSKEYLLNGIKSEFETLEKLNEKGKLSADQKIRYDVCKTAINDSTVENIFDAIHPTEMQRLLDLCNARAMEQYFKNPNKFSKWVNNLADNHPISAELLSWVVPFPKVASNIMAMAVRYSPLGFVRGILQVNKTQQAKNLKSDKYNVDLMQSEYIRSFSEASVGTVLLLAGALFAALGWVDIEDDDYMGLSLKAGDIRISLKDMAPALTTFSVAASVAYGIKTKSNGFKHALNTLYDSTLLGNIENAFRYSSPEQYAQNLSISYFASYIPAIVKLASKIGTNNAYKDKTGTYWQRVGATLGSYIPVVSNYAVPDKVNPYTGGKQYNTGTASGWFNFLAAISPLQLEKEDKSQFQKEAESVNATTAGFSGAFTINDKDIKLTQFDKEKYAQYRAEYANDLFTKITSDKELVTIKNDKGKYITKKYSSLTDKEKQSVISSIYSKSTNITKIKYWLDEGNTYVCTDKTQYNEYKKLFGGSANIIYKAKWSVSKFVEGK